MKIQKTIYSVINHMMGVCVLGGGGEVIHVMSENLNPQSKLSMAFPEWNLYSQ